MTALNIKPTHKIVKDYFDELSRITAQGGLNEGAVKPAFSKLLSHCCKSKQLTLVEEQTYGKIRVDGVIKDESQFPLGYWEAKDTNDDLPTEIKKKFAKGYPKTNILFQSPGHAILYQDGEKILDCDLNNADYLIEAIAVFLSYQKPEYKEWTKAVEEFKGRVPELAEELKKKIEEERQGNQRFIAAFNGFADLCRNAINPNIADAAIEEMLIQHLLTERIFSRVFDNPEFAKRNVIASEIEKVIDALTSRSFSRQEFLKKLDRFYAAIERAASTISDFSQKQGFLNTVYEKFFQGFAVKVADTHGIVYTPQPVVEFMVKSVDELLRAEFGRSLGDAGVHILDPFVGTGNFLLHVMRAIPKTLLAQKYASELHCNEVMLLPYYIASMNIEHEYFTQTGEYKPFEGICLVDTFELAEPKNKEFSFLTQANTARVNKQKNSPIFVIIGNPPYNAHQINENDNSKNRKYPVIDKRVAETYAKSSMATNKNALSDVYVKAFRWASDRISDEGIVAFVSNNSFINNFTFDGMRKHLANDFSSLYILDLGGDVRKNPKISGTSHNVFGIQVGVSINLLIKKKNAKMGEINVFYNSVDAFWRKEQKYDYLSGKSSYKGIDWQKLQPNKKNNWLVDGHQEDFETLVPIGTKEAKSGDTNESIFSIYSNGVVTNRDVWTYNFIKDELGSNMQRMINTYNEHVFRWSRSSSPKGKAIDDFVTNDDKNIKWCSRLKECLKRGQFAEFSKIKIRNSLYRPFCFQYIYFDEIMIHRQGQFRSIIPTLECENENKIICLPAIGATKTFHCLATNLISDLHLTGDSQCFPFYIYNEDGANRRENITDWALNQFKTHYNNKKITKWDIFYYVYGLLHSKAYRARYEANLKRELPRLPYAPDFFAFAKAGKRLADLHLNYETAPEWPLLRVENPKLPLDWRVDKMKLSKDKKQIVYNDFLTLTGVPEAAYEYRLGNRSALEWVIDQYQISVDKRSGITNDPNRLDDPQYIVRLLGQVITVSVETVKIVNSLPEIQ